MAVSMFKIRADEVAREIAAFVKQRYGYNCLVYIDQRDFDYAYDKDMRVRVAPKGVEVHGYLPGPVQGEWVDDYLTDLKPMAAPASATKKQKSPSKVLLIKRR